MNSEEKVIKMFSNTVIKYNCATERQIFNSTIHSLDVASDQLPQSPEPQALSICKGGQLATSTPLGVS